MWVRVLLINLLMSVAVLAQGPIPIARDTSRASKNLQLVSKTIQRQIDALAQYRDSNYVQWGIDTVALTDSVTVTIGIQYASGESYAADAIKDINTSLGLWCSTYTDSTFVVHNPNGTQIIFRWKTVGIKKKE